MLFAPKPPARFRDAAQYPAESPISLRRFSGSTAGAPYMDENDIVAHISHVIAAGWIPETRILSCGGIRKVSIFLRSILSWRSSGRLRLDIKSGLANDVWKVFQFLAGDFPSARIQDPANTNNLISDDLDADHHVDAADGAARGRCRHGSSTSQQSELLMYILGMVDQPGQILALDFGHPSWPGTEQDRKVTGITAVSGRGSPDSTLLTPSGASSRPSRMAGAASP